MKLKHEIRERLVMIPGISTEPIVTTGRLKIKRYGDEDQICAEALMPSVAGRQFSGEGCWIALDVLYAAIEAADST